MAFEIVPKGMEIIVHTDHLNLLYGKNASHKILRWRLIAEAFASKKIILIAREDSTVADCLSRLKMEHRDFDQIETEARKPMLRYCNMLHNMEQLSSLKDSLKETIEEEPFFP